MAYARIRALVQASAQSDYEQRSEHQTAWAADSSAADIRIQDSFTTGAGATTYNLDHLSDVSFLMIENLSTSVIVLLSFTTDCGNVAGATAISDADLEIGPGKFVVLTDIDVSANIILTPDSGTVTCHISYEGAI